jgi:hypothetical protein
LGIKKDLFYQIKREENSRYLYRKKFLKRKLSQLINCSVHATIDLIGLNKRSSIAIFIWLTLAIFNSSSSSASIQISRLVLDLFFTIFLPFSNADGRKMKKMNRRIIFIKISFTKLK